ncbi:MAG TPA: IS1595 family transposase [Candidatus Dormibacteraeota bacterium]|nr:IS1595 family transposase [Candidatus Dormibacteraeota bacterium]
MNLTEMIQDFADEGKCRAYLESLRWPNGVTCLRCEADKVYRRVSRNQFLCASCGYEFSVTVDTIFHDTHLPLVTWFLATFLLSEAKKGMSACQIQRSLGIKTYKTAWYLCHRIRAAMAEANRPKLSGIVVMDETYAGGRAHGKTGRGAANKEVVIGIRQGQGELRFFHSEDVRTGTLEKYIRENINEDVDLFVTDDFHLYRGAARRIGIKARHRTVRHGMHQYVDGEIHTNTVESAFSLLKRGVIGTWHRIGAKHLQAYCDEMCFRFNNRKNPYLFRDTILKLINSNNIEYKQLTANAQNAA